MFYAQKLNFYLYRFYDSEILFSKFCFKKHRMTSPYKIVINVDIGMLLTWNFQKTFKTKFGSLKNRGKPKACPNFSILTEKSWQGKIYPPPWRIGLRIKHERFSKTSEIWCTRNLNHPYAKNIKSLLKNTL